MRRAITPATKKIPALIAQTFISHPEIRDHIHKASTLCKFCVLISTTLLANLAGQENAYKTMITRKSLFSTSEAAYAVDRDGQIVAWNQAAVKTFGYAESKALGQRCWKLLSGWDVFGNVSCCEGCPVRATAFDNEPIKRFQVDFETAVHERKRFTVSTLMLFNGPGKELFVHLCHPASDVTENTATEHTTNHSVVSNQHKALTPRQTDVLTLLHKGLTVPEIAAALNVSPSTIRNHTQHILLHLHVHSRFEAVALGRRLKLI